MEQPIPKICPHVIEQGHDAKFWAWVDRYPRAERAKGFLLGWSAAANIEPPASDVEDEGAEGGS